ncbi:MAG TPA: carboxypeptidase regulatory-like domain-containing protein, partial [Gemmatimonadales bacterium]
MTSRTGLTALAAVGAALLFAQPLAAQADVIRGKVTAASVDNSPVMGVVVSVVSISGNVTRTAKTGSDGRFTVTFPGGDGDYWVSFAAVGFTPRRFEVKRLADESILVADARLTATNIQLDTIVSNATGARRRPTRNDNTRDVGGTERAINPNLVPPDQAGDLAALAATLPGVSFIPGTNGDPSGFSVLGLSTDQNLTNLNGLASGASDLPRDAGISVSVSTSPYDVSRGGFSGGALDIRTQPGSNYFSRALSMVGNAPALEWTDAAGRSLGQEYTNGSLGGNFSGPLSFDQAFYNTSFQLGRRANDLTTLLNTDSLGLQTEGVQPDSVKRLLGILQGAGVPA